MEKIQKNIKEPQSNMEQTYFETIKVVLFDMDNTLFDFVAAKLIACREILLYIAREKHLARERELLWETHQNFSGIFLEKFI